MTFTAILAGVLLLLLMLVDVFLTVFHPTAHAGPLTRLQSRVVWRLTRLIGGCGRRRSDRILSLGGPAIAALTPIAWVVLLVTGFSLIHWPFVLSFAFEPGRPGPRWIEALYYSGYLATTLGLGDVIPSHGPQRLVAITEAVLGFGLFSVGITYVLSIYSQQSVQTALATTIDHALRDAPPIDWRYPEPQQLEWAASLARDVAGQLARVNTANRQYPILHYFRHPRSGEALVVQVGRLIRWIRDMEAARPERDWFSAPSPFVSMRRSLEDYLSEVPIHVVPGGNGRRGIDWDDQHRRLLCYLCYDNVPAAATAGP